MALAGDVECSFGATLVGFIADLKNASLQTGLFSAVIFPVLIFLCVLMLTGKKMTENMSR